MSNRRSKITVSPIIYEKDTNGDYVLDTNGDRIIVNDNIYEISSSSDYDINIQIQE